MTNELLKMIDTVEINEVANVLNKVSAMQTAISGALKSGHDFDTIPGTFKPTLLKPGAEKILMMFSLTSEYEILEKVEDYKNGVFAYTVRCILSAGGNKITEGLGSCNSRENRYRWRWVYERDVPVGIDISTLKSKKNDSGFIQYQVENDDIYTQVNTILKMAKKRAQVDAVLTVASLSEIFTQDMEDMKEYVETEKMDNMTATSAGNTKVTFGKYKGLTLDEIAQQDKSYVKWIAEKGQTEHIKKAAEMVLNRKSGSMAKAVAETRVKNDIIDAEVIEEYTVDDDNLPFDMQGE